MNSSEFENNKLEDEIELPMQKQENTNTPNDLNIGEEINNSNSEQIVDTQIINNEQNELVNNIESQDITIVEYQDIDNDENQEIDNEEYKKDETITIKPSTFKLLFKYYYSLPILIVLGMYISYIIFVGNNSSFFSSNSNVYGNILMITFIATGIFSFIDSIRLLVKHFDNKKGNLLKTILVVTNGILLSNLLLYIFSELISYLTLTGIIKFSILNITNIEVIFLVLLLLGFAISIISYIVKKINKDNYVSSGVATIIYILMIITGIAIWFLYNFVYGYIFIFFITPCVLIGLVNDSNTCAKCTFNDWCLIIVLIALHYGTDVVFNELYKNYLKNLYSSFYY